MKRQLRAYSRFICGLPGFLNRPVSFGQARETVLRRLARREESFLALVRRAVYGNPCSPYLPLLNHARCEYGDMEQGVPRRGLEGFLRELKDAGVWVSLEEFKGAAPLRRGPAQTDGEKADFRNVLASGGCEVTSGGSSGRASRTRMDLDFLADRAVYDHLAFKMLDLYDVPLALWYPRLPASTGVGNSLRYAKIGHPPRRWFCMLSDERVRPGLEHRVATEFIVWASRLTRFPLARPEPVSLKKVGIVLDWIEDACRRGGRCVLQSYVSQALRVSQAASQRGVRLDGTLFIVGSEPLTPAKHHQIESLGARVYPRYHATELGSIAMGCGDPREPGEYHLGSDMIAMIQEEAQEGEPAPFYYTTLLDTMPSIMINVRLGDSGVVDRRPCGCLLEEVGLTTHLRKVSSFQRAVGEGMAVDIRLLVRVVEEVLPAKYGGTSLDYQWVEGEDGRALTRLCLRVSPRLDGIDPAALVQTVLAEVRKCEGGGLMSEMWREGGTIRVLREPPLLTAMGKHSPWRRTGAAS